MKKKTNSSESPRTGIFYKVLVTGGGVRESTVVASETKARTAVKSLGARVLSAAMKAGKNIVSVKAKISTSRI